MLYTIGHSNHSLEQFISLLKKYEIEAIADVRSHPYSRYLPHFSQKPLQQQLSQYNINYHFFGKELGARPDNPDCYVNAKAVYAKIAETKEFKEGIQQLLNLANSTKTTLMCSEKDPITCHRSILICQHLTPFNLEISHILPNGQLETQTELETRLLKQHNIIKNNLQLSLFETINPNSTELLQQAYQFQGEKIAYKQKHN